MMGLLITGGLEGILDASEFKSSATAVLIVLNPNIHVRNILRVVFTVHLENHHSKKILFYHNHSFFPPGISSDLVVHLQTPVIYVKKILKI